jgi:ATP-dependent RNA helicase RhlE
MPLAGPIQAALEKKGYATPSPIQAEAIPVLLEGRDLLGVAQTGTGKTAAFALPLLQALGERPRRMRAGQARSLILTPTRELAEQVATSIRTYGVNVNFNCVQVFGGVSAGAQIRGMKRGADILVATPGRLLDLIDQGHIDLSEVETFILDEADRMLDMGFINDIREIIAMLPEQRQSVCFSATVSPAIGRLVSKLLKDPVEIRIAPESTTAERVDHKVCFVQTDHKSPLLESLLTEQQAREGRHLTLVFSRTKHGADKLAKALGRGGIPAESIHGNKTQAARRRALESFRTGKTPVLVATDVAARGIDVKDVTLVINYDLPDEPEAYVHRIGRTARGGCEGLALSFCSADRLKELRAIEAVIKQPVTVFEDHPYHCTKTRERYQQRGRGGQHRGPGGHSGKDNRHGRGFKRGGKPFGGRKAQRKPAGKRA